MVRKGIESTLFGPETKIMNESEYAIAELLTRESTVVFPVANGEVNFHVYNELQNMNRIIIPFDLIDLPSQFYTSTKRTTRTGKTKIDQNKGMGRPDLLILERQEFCDYIIRAVDIKHAKNTTTKTNQISATNTMRLIEKSPYMQEVVKMLEKNFGITPENTIIDNGYAAYFMNTKKISGYGEFLLKDIKEVLQSPSLEHLLEIKEVEEHIETVSRVNSLDVLSAIREVKNTINDQGTSPYSVIVIEGLDSKQEVIKRFEYIQGKRIETHPYELLQLEEKKEELEHADLTTYNGKIVERIYQETFKIIDGRMARLRFAIENDQRKYEEQQEKLVYKKNNSRHQQKLIKKYHELGKIIKEKNDELKEYHRLKIQKQEELYDQRQKSAYYTVEGFKKHFQAHQDQIKLVEEEIKTMRNKFEIRRSTEKSLENKLKQKEKDNSFMIITTNNIPAVLYINKDSQSYYKIVLQPQKVFKPS